MSYDLAVRLQEVKHRNARLRCEAFIDYNPIVCGIRLQPITLASYNRLLAFESPFVTGGPIDLEAIAVFIWLHHPAFSQHAPHARRQVLRLVYRSLHPRFPNLNTFLHFIAPILGAAKNTKKFSCLSLCALCSLWLIRLIIRPPAAERYTDAIAEIRRLLHEALHALPRGGGSDEENEEQARRNTEPPPISFFAQLLNTFRREFSLSYAETESIPLKRLVQLERERIYQATGGKGLSLMDPEVAAIWHEHLGRKNQAPATRPLTVP